MSQHRRVNFINSLKATEIGRWPELEEEFRTWMEQHRTQELLVGDGRNYGHVTFDQAELTAAEHYSTPGARAQDQGTTPHWTVQITNAELRGRSAWYNVHWRPARSGERSVIVEKPTNKEEWERKKEIKRKQKQKARDRNERRRGDRDDKDEGDSGALGKQGGTTGGRAEKSRHDEKTPRDREGTENREGKSRSHGHNGGSVSDLLESMSISDSRREHGRHHDSKADRRREDGRYDDSKADRRREDGRYDDSKADRRREDGRHHDSKSDRRREDGRYDDSKSDRRREDGRYGDLKADRHREDGRYDDLKADRHREDGRDDLKVDRYDTHHRRR